MSKRLLSIIPLTVMVSGFVSANMPTTDEFIQQCVIERDGPALLIKAEPEEPELKYLVSGESLLPHLYFLIGEVFGENADFIDTLEIAPWRGFLEISGESYMLILEELLQIVNLRIVVTKNNVIGLERPQNQNQSGIHYHDKIVVKNNMFTNLSNRDPVIIQPGSVKDNIRAIAMEHLGIEPENVIFNGLECDLKERFNYVIPEHEYATDAGKLEYYASLYGFEAIIERVTSSVHLTYKGALSCSEGNKNEN